MQYVLEQEACHRTVLDSRHTSSATEKNPLTEIQEGELYLCLEHRIVRVRERIRVFMATLRKKIEKGSNSTQYIQTHIGVGYRMLKVE